VVVLVKFILSSLLLGVSGGVPINSTYYLVYYLPVVTAAFLYGLWGTLAWMVIAAAAYISYLIPALEEFELTDVGRNELALRIVFLFLVGILVNRFVTESRRQTGRYQHLAETLAATNQKLKQAQAEARRSERLAALGQLSAGLAHEIRNPLGVIKGSAEMLNKRIQQSDSVAAELTSYIYSEVNRLNGLVSRFLDFARPLKIDAHLQDIVPVIEQALKNVRAQYPQASLEVLPEYEAGLSPVMIDAGACEQVFTNLFSNAFEAMPKGGKLQIAAKAGSSDGRPGVEVQVEDNGPGIPAELREQVFNPFFTTKKEGVGLGLSIVSKIVDDHQGWIRISSPEGQGACFRLFFPC
jgi:two-component system sensor histidine kinase HydH